MAIDLDLDSDRMDAGSIGASDLNQAIHLNSLDPQKAAEIKNTHEAALPAIQNTDHPSLADKSLNGRTTLGAPEQMDLDPSIDLDALGLDREKWDYSWKAVSEFPSLAWEAVKAGLAKEEQSNDVLDRHIQEAENHQKIIDMQLEFSAELTALGDKSEMTPKMKALVKELKANGVDLKVDENTKITKDKAIELKSLNSSFMDQRRSKLQILFATKIQVVIQNISSIMETLKNIVKSNDQLVSRINGHSGGR